MLFPDEPRATVIRDRRNYVAVNADGKAFSLSRWCGVKTRLLRARLGDPGDLPNVDDAPALLPANADALDATRLSEPDLAFEVALAEIVAHQRDERTASEKAQSERRVLELKARQSRLPRGMADASSDIWNRRAELRQKYGHMLSLLTVWTVKVVSPPPA